jgi:hypothetical protein
MNLTYLWSSLTVSGPFLKALGARFPDSADKKKNTGHAVKFESQILKRAYISYKFVANFALIKKNIHCLY